MFLPTGPPYEFIILKFIIHKFNLFFVSNDVETAFDSITASKRPAMIFYTPEIK